MDTPLAGELGNGSQGKRSKLITRHMRVGNCLDDAAAEAGAVSAEAVPKRKLADSHRFAPQLESCRSAGAGDDDDDVDDNNFMAAGAVSSQADCCCQCNHSSSGAKSESGAANEMGHRLQQPQPPRLRQPATSPGQQLAASDAARVHALMSGRGCCGQQLVLPPPPPASRPAATCNLICRRSNSELCAANLRGQPTALMDPMHGDEPPALSKTEQALLGRMQSSLLARRQQQQQRLEPPVGKKISLAAYLGAGAIIPPALVLPPYVGKSKLSAAAAAAKANKSKSSKSGPFDDNFILRRKTPNAGLRTRC